MIDWLVFNCLGNFVTASFNTWEKPVCLGRTTELRYENWRLRLELDAYATYGTRANSISVDKIVIFWPLRWHITHMCMMCNRPICHPVKFKKKKKWNSLLEIAKKNHDDIIQVFELFSSISWLIIYITFNFCVKMTIVVTGFCMHRHLLQTVM